MPKNSPRGPKKTKHSQTSGKPSHGKPRGERTAAHKQKTARGAKESPRLSSGQKPQKPRGAKSSQAPRKSPAPRRQEPLNQRLVADLLPLLEGEPLQAAGIASALRLDRSNLPLLDQTLATLERTGRIVRVRKDHYILPETADLFTGKLQIHAGGSGHVLADQEGGKDLFISADNLGTALHGDRVVARLIHQPRFHGRPRRDGRQEEEVRRRDAEVQAVPTGQGDPQVRNQPQAGLNGF